MNAEIIDRLESSFMENTEDKTIWYLQKEFEELDHDVMQRMERVEQKVRALEAQFDTIKDKHGEN